MKPTSAQSSAVHNRPAVPASRVTITGKPQDPAAAQFGGVARDRLEPERARSPLAEALAVRRLRCTVRPAAAGGQVAGEIVGTQRIVTGGRLSAFVGAW